MRSLERAANETDEEMTPESKTTKNDGNLPKNDNLSINEDIWKTQEILDISINSNKEKISYEDFYIQQIIQEFQNNSDKDCVIEFAEKHEKENLIKQTEDLETRRLIECFDAKEYIYMRKGTILKKNLIKCLKLLKNRKQTLIDTIIFLNKTRRK